MVVAVRDHEHFRLKLLYTQKKKVEQENKQLRQDKDKYSVSFTMSRELITSKKHACSIADESNIMFVVFATSSAYCRVKCKQQVINLWLLRTLLSPWSCPKSMAIVVSLSGRPDNACWLHPNHTITGDQCFSHSVRTIGTFARFKASPWWPRMTKAIFFFTVTLGTQYRNNSDRFTSFIQ